MPGVEPTQEVRRFQRYVAAAVGLAAVLGWASFLVLGLKVGTNICSDYTYTVGGANPKLRAWCQGTAWQGWLPSWLVVAAALLVIAYVICWATNRLWAMAAGTFLAAVAVWLGFAYPQAAAGPATTTTPVATLPPPPSTSPPTVPVGQPAQPALPPLPQPIEVGHARGLGHGFQGDPYFRCPKPHQPPEILHGPNHRTNFDRVVLYRSPTTVCATFESRQIDSLTQHQEPSIVIDVILPEPGHRVNPRFHQDHAVNIWISASDNGRAYSLGVVPPQQMAQPVTVGNLGIASGHLSILIEQPHLPAWAVQPSDNWTALLT